MFDLLPKRLFAIAFIVLVIYVYFEQRKVDALRDRVNELCPTEARTVIYEHGSYHGLMTGAGNHPGGVSAGDMIASGSLAFVEYRYAGGGYRRFFAAPLGDDRCFDGDHDSYSKYPEFAAAHCIASEITYAPISDVTTVSYRDALPGHPDISRLNFLLVERDSGRVIAEQIRLMASAYQLWDQRTFRCPPGGSDHAPRLVTQVILGQSADVEVVAGPGRTLSDVEMNRFEINRLVAESVEMSTLPDTSGLPQTYGGDVDGIFDAEATVHGIGVFGSVDNLDVVNVNIENADNIVLVLSARYSVLWEIDARNSDIDHVLVFGGDPQAVTGLAAEVPVSNYSTNAVPGVPNVWAWDIDSRGFSGLRGRVRGITGRVFESFQGARSAQSFELHFAPQRDGTVESWVDEEGVINYSDRPATN